MVVVVVFFVLRLLFLFLVTYRQTVSDSEKGGECDIRTHCNVHCVISEFVQ